MPQPNTPNQTLPEGDAAPLSTVVSAETSSEAAFEDFFNDLDSLNVLSQNEDEETLDDPSAPVDEELATDPSAEEDAAEPEESGEEESPDGEEPADLDDIPAEYQRKVGELIAKTRKKERAKAAALEQELAELKGQTGNATADLEKLRAEHQSLLAEKIIPVNLPNDPFPEVQTIDQLNETVSRLREYRDYLELNQDGFDLEHEGEKKFVAPEQVKKHLIAFRKRLEVDVPRKQHLIQQTEQSEAWLAKNFPDLQKPNSELSRSVNQIMVKFPAVKTVPGARQAALAIHLGSTLLKMHGAQSLEVIKNVGKPAKTPLTPAAKRPPPSPAEPTRKGARTSSPIQGKKKLSDQEWSDALDAMITRIT